MALHNPQPMAVGMSPQGTRVSGHSETAGSHRHWPLSKTKRGQYLYFHPHITNTNTPM